MDLPKGYLLHNRYRIEAVLGQGGFGKTYKVFDVSLNQYYCIKELYIGGSSTRSVDYSVNSITVNGLAFSDFKQKFIREAQDLARFRHPNIVQVINVFEANNTAYYVMEFIEGTTLKELVERNGPYHRDAAIPLMRQLLDAVEEVHKRGMLHRDIKPSNVLVTKEGRLVLIDFGSAREFQSGQASTQTALVTPGYAPLEQYSEQGRRDVTSDIYALGATLYFLLTGIRPLAAPDRLEDSLPLPHELNPRVDSQISSAVMLAMEMRSVDRFQSVTAFRDALELLSRNKTPMSSSVPGSDGGKESPTNSSRFTLWFVLLFLILASLSAVVLEYNANKHTSKFISNDPIQQILNNMVYVPGGTFTMGCSPEQGSDCLDSERPPNSVSLNNYRIGRFEVTQAQWRIVMERDPPELFNTGCDLCPVESVSWNDVEQFIGRLNNRTGKDFRLPTEAEWEFAASGGNKSKGYKYSGSNDIKKVAWYVGNSESGNKYGTEKTTRPVGLKKANELGLYDMSGNVWEWCSDWFKGYSGSYGVADRTGSHRVDRGGGWSDEQARCRVSNRSRSKPMYRNKNLGFRLAADE